KLNALTIVAAENQVHDYYMNIGPIFADPVARMLYAEIASIEEQHVTQYESIIDPDETWLEKWLLRECNEVWNYWSCVESEDDPRIQRIWQRMLDYELGQLHFVADLFKQVERRDPAEVLPQTLPDPIPYVSQRDFVRATLAEVPFRAVKEEIGQLQDSAATTAYRQHMNSEGAPSEAIAAGYVWQPGTELAARR
ncbi:MAG: hypothetical protein KIT58_13680, partial [Planctomycetota bacterium]|nr:hypothetical protein [Planctomycetota bacterium]